MNKLFCLEVEIFGLFQIEVFPCAPPAPTSFTQNQFQVGRQFDENDELVSKLTRESIDLLKEFHQDSMTRSDWHLVIALKKQFGIM